MARWEYYRVVADGPRGDDLYGVEGALSEEHVAQIEAMDEAGWELVLAQPGRERIGGASDETRPVMVFLFRRPRA